MKDSEIIKAIEDLADMLESTTGMFFIQHPEYAQEVEHIVATTFMTLLASTAALSVLGRAETSEEETKLVELFSTTMGDGLRTSIRDAVNMLRGQQEEYGQLFEFKPKGKPDVEN